MTAVDGKLYVSGGGGNIATTCGEVLDLETMQWEALPPMRTARYAHGGWLAWGSDGFGWAAARVCGG